ncbi:MAG: hypothetical protein ACFFAS_20785 [Promethearchaeota archaeon]
MSIFKKNVSLWKNAKNVSLWKNAASMTKIEPSLSADTMEQIRQLSEGSEFRIIAKRVVDFVKGEKITLGQMAYEAGVHDIATADAYVRQILTVAFHTDTEIAESYYAQIISTNEFESGWLNEIDTESFTFISTIGPEGREMSIPIPKGVSVGFAKYLVGQKFGLDPLEFHLSGGGITLDEFQIFDNYLHGNLDDILPYEFNLENNKILIIPASTEGARHEGERLSSTVDMLFELRDYETLAMIAREKGKTLVSKSGVVIDKDGNILGGGEHNIIKGTDTLKIIPESHPTWIYIESIRDVLSDIRGYRVNNKDLTTFLGVGEVFVSQKRKAIKDALSGINPDKSPIIDSRTIYRLEHECEQFGGLTPQHLKQLYTATQIYERRTNQIRSITESIHLRLRKSFSSGTHRLISRQDLDRLVGIHLSHKLSTEPDLSDEHIAYIHYSISKLMYKITRYNDPNFNREECLSAIFDLALIYDHPMINNLNEYVLLEALRYAIADESGEFLTYTQLSLRLGMDKGWASRLINEGSAISEFTLMKITLFIENVLSNPESIKLSLFALLNYERFDRIKNVRSVAASRASSVINKNSRHRQWRSLREVHYRRLMVQQMGMDAITGESICPNDVAMTEIDRHHWNYKKWSILLDDLVLTLRRNHMTISHPPKYLSGYYTYFPMLWPHNSIYNMDLLRSRKENFKKLEPPDDWSAELKQTYYDRKALYLVYGFQVFNWFSSSNS